MIEYSYLIYGYLFLFIFHLRLIRFTRMLIKIPKLNINLKILVFFLLLYNLNYYIIPLITVNSIFDKPNYTLTLISKNIYYLSGLMIIQSLYNISQKNETLQPNFMVFYLYMLYVFFMELSQILNISLVFF